MSSRVLFRTDKEQKVYDEKGVEEYLRYQGEHENEPLAPGPAFPFVKVTKTSTPLINLFITEVYAFLIYPTMPIL